MVYIILYDDAVDVASLPLSAPASSSHSHPRHTRAGLPRVQPAEQEPGQL